MAQNPASAPPSTVLAVGNDLMAVPGMPAFVNPSPIQTFAVLFGGATALLITGLQPLVLGQLAEEGRLSASGIGLAATIEFLAIGIAAAVSGALLKPAHLRLIGLVAALIHAAATLATAAAVADLGVIVSRGVAGLAAGVLLWSAIGMIARTAQPERWAGSFLTGQTLAQLAVAAILPVTVVPVYGVDGALFAMATISGVAAICALIGPNAYAPLSKTEVDAPSAGLTVRSLLGLLAVFSFMGAVTAVWVYLEPLGLQLGLPPATISVALAVVLGFQVVGGTTATLIGSRLPFLAALTAAVVLGIGAFCVLGVSQTTPVFVAASAVFGFLWLFALPYQLLFLVEIDPTRHAILQLPAAQLLGSAAGPLLASFLVSDGDAVPALVLGDGCLVLTLVLVGALHLTAARRA